MTPNITSLNRILPMTNRKSPMKSDEAIGPNTHVPKLKPQDETSELGLCIKQEAPSFSKSKERSGGASTNQNASSSAQSPSNLKRRDSSHSNSPEKKKGGFLSRLGRCIFGKSKKKRESPDGLKENQSSVDIPSTPDKKETAEGQDTSSLATPPKRAIFSRVLHNPVTPIKSYNIDAVRIEMERSPGNDSFDAAQKPLETASAPNVNNETKGCTRRNSPLHRSTSPSEGNNIGDASRVLMDFLARKTQEMPSQDDVTDSPGKSLLLAMARLNGLKSKPGTKSFMLLEEKAKHVRIRREFFQSTVFRKIKYRMSKNERPQYLIATSLDKVTEYVVSTHDIPTTPGKKVLLTADKEKMEVTGPKSQEKTSKASRRLVPHMDDLPAEMKQDQMVRNERQTSTFSDRDFADETAKANDPCDFTSATPTNSMDTKKIKTGEESHHASVVPNSQFCTRARDKYTVRFNSESSINDDHISSEASFKNAVAKSVKGEALFLDI